METPTTRKLEIPSEKLHEIFVAMTKVEQRIDEALRILFRLNGIDKISQEYFQSL